MAKSLRSKRQRKMRAIKRERYGQKELAKLKSILGLEGGSTNSDVLMENVADIATVTDAKAIKQSSSGDAMEHDQLKVFNRRTFRDQDGKYPEWMSMRKVRAKAFKKKTERKKKRKLSKRQKKQSA